MYFTLQADNIHPTGTSLSACRTGLNMSKRISLTLSDTEYSALVQAVGVIITTTGTATNPTEYIRGAITQAICKDLKLNQISDFRK